MDLNEAYIALIGTVFGGVGLKVTEAWLGRAGRRDTTASSLRTELRLELSTMRVEMEKLKKEAEQHDRAVDEWRDRYYALLAAVATNDEAVITRLLGRKGRG